jgi:hypothetical protein
MTPKPDCPICPPGTCKGYPFLWRMMAEKPEKYAAIHARANESDADRAARLIAENPQSSRRRGRRGCCG